MLLVSGRLSFELVQKAAVAGIPVLCAVSAPSSLAVATAERFGQTVVGFLRDDRFNVYTHPERIDLDALRHRIAWPTEARSRPSQDAQAAPARPVGRLEAERHRRAEAEPLPRDRARRSGRTGGNLPYAWRILSKGVCDGCALGVAGFHDWTITGVHLCTTRLDLLQAQHRDGARPTRALADVDAARRAATAASCASSAASRIRWCAARASAGSRGSRGTTRST